MKVIKVSVKKRIKLDDGQYVEIGLTGKMPEEEAESGRKLLLNILYSGVMAVLKKEIVEPIEARHKKPEHAGGLKAA